jgi:hypothetical protein
VPYERLPPVTQPSRLSNLLWLGFLVTVLVLGLTHHYRACCALGAACFAWSIIPALLRPTTLLPRIFSATAFGVWGVVCALYAAGIDINAVSLIACGVGFLLFFAGVSLDPTLKKE